MPTKKNKKKDILDKVKEILNKIKLEVLRHF